MQLIGCGTRRRESRRTREGSIEMNLRPFELVSSESGRENNCRSTSEKRLIEKIFALQFIARSVRATGVREPRIEMLRLWERRGQRRPKRKKFA